jgi:hypothetical protein
MSENNEVVGGDVSLGAAHIAKNPWDYGFQWSDGPISGRLSKGGDLVLLRKECPRIEVRPDQVPMFLATFGTAIVAKAINGTSIDVTCERIARDMLVKDRSVTDAQLKERMVASALLGVITRTVGTKTKFVGVDGKEYDTLEAAQAAVAGNTKAEQVAKAQAFLAMCQENGVDAEVARNLAKVQFPEAFA